MTDDFATDFDMFDQSLITIEEFFEVSASFRTQCPVGWTERNGGGMWVLTKYDDIREVLRDPGTFSSRTATIPPLPVRTLSGSNVPRVLRRQVRERRRIYRPRLSCHQRSLI